MVVSRSAAVLLLLVLAGCGRGQAATPQDVQVAVGSQKVPVHPTQYCLDGDGKRYDISPPIIEVSPDSTIALTVPASVAKQGWSVQVFDEKLEEPIGEGNWPCFCWSTSFVHVLSTNWPPESSGRRTRSIESHHKPTVACGQREFWWLMRRAIDRGECKWLAGRGWAVFVHALRSKQPRVPSFKSGASHACRPSPHIV